MSLFTPFREIPYPFLHTPNATSSKLITKKFILFTNLNISCRNGTQQKALRLGCWRIRNNAKQLEKESKIRNKLIVQEQNMANFYTKTPIQNTLTIDFFFELYYNVSVKLKHLFNAFVESRII